MSKAWALCMMAKYLPPESFQMCAEFLGCPIEQAIKLMESIGYPDCVVAMEDGCPVIYYRGQRRVFLMEPASEE